MTEQEKWHVSKSIPIMFILAVFLQTSAIVWGASNLSTRVESIEDWIKTNANTQIIIMENRQILKDHDRRIEKLESHRQ